MLPDFGGIVVVENYSFLDLVSVACWTGFLSVVWHSWRIFSKQSEGFNDWGGRGYDDFVPEEVTKAAPSGDETTRFPTWSASLPQINRI